MGGGADDLGLVYMNARYYVPDIGRFASADTIVPEPKDPQTFNRLSYVNNRVLVSIDPSGHCGQVLMKNGDDETLVRDTKNDQHCWDHYDEFRNFIESQTNEYRDYYKFDWDEIATLDWSSIYGRNLWHEERADYPPSCRGGSGNCATDKWHQMVDNFLEEVLPDAGLIGMNSGIQGAMSIYGGAELLYGPNREAGAFTFEGVGVAGIGGSIDASPLTGGFVWNLENLDDYEGEFWSLTVEASAGKGNSISIFGSPGEYPFSGGTWGVSVGEVIGVGVSASYAETNYTRRHLK